MKKKIKYTQMKRKKTPQITSKTIDFEMSKNKVKINFLKYILLKKYMKINLFLASIYQNNLKNIKK